jgi:predicted nucleic acid-binding protein
VTIVVDASVAARWLLKLPGFESAETLVKRAGAIIAPDIIIRETTSALWKAIVFANLPIADAQLAVESLDDILDELVPTSAHKRRALSIAVELHHPVYDCFYLALAEERSCTFITADDRLLRRCKGSTFERLVEALE